MNRLIKQFAATAIALLAHSASIAADNTANANNDIAKIAITRVNGLPAIAMQDQNRTLTARSVILAAGPNKIQIKPIDGQLELRIGSLTICTAELHVRNDAEIHQIELLELNIREKNRADQQDRTMRSTEAAGDVPR